MRDMTQADMIRRLFGKGSSNTRPKPLPRNSVEHDSVDQMQFRMGADDSPRFRRIAIEERPQIAPNVPDPDPIDFTTAAPEEIKAWQEKAREAKAAREQAPEYDAWEELNQDIFYTYHHMSEPEVLPPEQVDPAVAHHSKIASKMTHEDEHAQSRNITRDNPTASYIATMAASRALKEALENALVDQARQSEEFEQSRQEAEGAMRELEDLRQQVRDGMPVTPDLKQQITDLVKAKRDAQAKAADQALAAPLPFDQAAHDAIKAAVQAGAEAAEAAENIPSFDQGFGEGEPRYNSPEQALSIAEMWANNPVLRKVSELYGRLDRDMRFQRARRVTGGADEIVDLKFGDDIRRMLPSELAGLADDDLEDDFYMRLLGGELRVYDTVGEEQAGRGPIVFSCDESASMSDARNIWAKALAMCLLNIARREKRDFCYIGWASGTQVYSVMFKAKDELDPEAIVEMASHFFNGGTTPILGLALADKIMSDVPEFKKADIVKVSDGEAGFGDEDKRLRDRMTEKGVRIWGVGIGGSFRYLHSLTDDVIDIQDFDLENPSEATAHLATHIS